MKTNKLNKLFLLAVVVLAILTACDKHDHIDDNVLVGKMAAHTYWDLSSSTVTAGDFVEFTAQYYSTSETPIDRLEVWYSLDQEEARMVSCPWITTFSYSYISTAVTEQRISQKVSEYAHDVANWNDSINAFLFTDRFPTSNTLGVTGWMTPTQFDSTKMVGYFGEGFMQHFKDSLYALMQFEDFRTMLMGLNLITDFKPYTEATFDENKKDSVYHFPQVGDEYPVPDDVRNAYESIPFADLIFNSSTSNYSVEFKRTYYLRAILKCIDENGTIGVALKKDVTLN
ncbi:MAG: hypothetical protein LBS16_01160 [Prevotellaceae bacterium]|jgi:hypothetical protein|nr:hypothetical protein [Prevotellaceae bacterium]